MGYFKKSNAASDPVDDTAKTDTVVQPAPTHFSPSERVPDLAVTTSNTAHTFALRKVTAFLYKFCPALMTKDTLNNTSFVEAFSTKVDQIERFLKIHAGYTKGKQRIRKQKTELLKTVEKIQESITKLTKLLENAAEIKLDIATGLHNISISAARKQSKLSEILVASAVLVRLITSSNVISKMKKRSRQVEYISEKSVKSVITPDLTFSCCNSGISWENAFNSLANVTLNESDLFELRKLASVIESETIIDISNLEIDKSILVLLEQKFPVVKVSRGGIELLMDVHEVKIKIDPSLFFEIFLGINKKDQKSPTSSQNDIFEEPTTGNTVKEVKEQDRIGRKPLHIKYPDLVECATNFIKENSFAAHSRRRETTGIGTGVGLKDIREHLLQHVPGLREHGISLDTIHHLMVAPRKNSSRSFRYKGLIDAKIPKKRNDNREFAPINTSFFHA